MSLTKQERIEKLLTRWKPRLLLSDWGIVHKIIDAASTDDNPKRDVAYSAEIKVNSRYKEASINVFPVLFKKTRGLLEVTIVHELAHIHVDPIRDALHKAVERGVISAKTRDDLVEDITDYIAKTMYKAYCKGKKGSGGYHI